MTGINPHNKGHHFNVKQAGGDAQSHKQNDDAAAFSGSKAKGEGSFTDNTEALMESMSHAGTAAELNVIAGRVDGHIANFEAQFGKALNHAEKEFGSSLLNDMDVAMKLSDQVLKDFEPQFSI